MTVSGPCCGLTGPGENRLTGLTIGPFGDGSWGAEDPSELFGAELLLLHLEHLDASWCTPAYSSTPNIRPGAQDGGEGEESQQQERHRTT